MYPIRHWINKKQDLALFLPKRIYCKILHVSAALQDSWKFIFDEILFKLGAIEALYLFW